MEIRTVGVMSPGEMGHAVGRVLRGAGLPVITCLQGRSERTAARSAQAGIVPVGDDLALVRDADVILSILPPADAASMAERIAAAVRTTGSDLIYADCNAIAPQTTCKIGDVMAVVGVRYVDGSIIGGPPSSSQRPTRLYVSGPDAPALLPLQTLELEVRVVGPWIGQASGLKMCYAALTKGLTALATEALTAASALGLDGPLQQELQDSQEQLLTWIERAIPAMPRKADRWIGEMEEIAATFRGVGLPPELMAGAAALYRLVSEAAVGEESPGVQDPMRPVSGVAEQLATHASQKKSKAYSTGGSKGHPTSMAPVDAGTANHIAQHWLEAWNAHDARGVVAHFADDVTAISPLIELRRPGSHGRLQGRDQVLAYYEEGLALARDLHFEVVDVLRGVDQVTIVYRDQSQTLVVETLTVDKHGAVVAIQVSRGDLPAV